MTDKKELSAKDGENAADDKGDLQTKVSGLTGQLMQNPEVLAALQGKLAGIVGMNSGYIASLPKSVRRRVKALKKLQASASGIEAKFYEDIHELECKYMQLYEPLYNKRKDVVSGATEPTDEECEWPSDEEDTYEDMAENIKDKVNLKVKEADVPTVGIPNFWLTAFKNVDILASMIQEHDEPILEHLTDVKIQLTQKPMGFILEFYFSPNEHFSDVILTKTYEMRSEPEESDPLSFEGPEIVKCTGCNINWNNGKNVTVKLIKKKQKHKGRGTTRMVTKSVPNDSFFNFFAPPEVPENTEEEDIDDETGALLQADFEIGHFIRERVVPRAVLYFTGEGVDEDDDDEYDEEDEEDEEPATDDDEDDSRFIDGKA